MTFTLKIKCDNAAFGAEGDHEDREALITEIKRILEHAGRKAERMDDGLLNDINGNKVGSFTLK